MHMFAESFFLSFYTVVVVPECSPQLKPAVGQKFQSLDFAFAFYDVYARAVGFDTRKQGMRKTDGDTTWYSVVCNREGSKKSSEEDEVNARSGFSMKRRRLSKRCGCKASISFKFFSEGGERRPGTPTTSASEKRRMIEEFYGMPRPEVVEVHPPDVVKTKGHASSSASRLISKRENAIKEATRPLRRCKACDELGHHDSRNCPMLKEMENEKELLKGKRKC